MNAPRMVRRAVDDRRVRTVGRVLIDSLALLGISQWSMEDQARFYRARRAAACDLPDRAP